jgi:xanthine dehydrogenase accessory factor
MPGDVLLACAEAVRSGQSAALATVYRTHGSTPSTVGQKLVLTSSGTCVGSVGGGAVEKSVLLILAERLSQAHVDPSLHEFRLGAELGMCCGGRVEVMVEQLKRKREVLLIGAGHVGTALARMLPRLGYRVTVVDSREPWATELEAQKVQFGLARVIWGEPSEAVQHLAPDSIVLAMTHDHTLDQDAIEWALRAGYPFVGGVGSRAKAERTRQRLANKGFSEFDRARIHMPVGLDVGARSPEEIAVAIAAQLIAWQTEQAKTETAKATK